MPYFSFYWKTHYDEIPEGNNAYYLSVSEYEIDVDWMMRNGLRYAGYNDDGHKIWVAPSGMVYYYNDLKRLDRSSGVQGGDDGYGDDGSTTGGNAAAIEREGMNQYGGGDSPGYDAPRGTGYGQSYGTGEATNTRQVTGISSVANRAPVLNSIKPWNPGSVINTEAVIDRYPSTNVRQPANLLRQTKTARSSATGSYGIPRTNTTSRNTTNALIKTANKFPYEITQRSFAPWERFGDLGGIDNAVIRAKICEGDNRGFSLRQGARTWDVGKTTARIHEVTKIKTNVDGVIDDKPFASQTSCYPSAMVLITLPKQDIATAVVKTDVSFRRNVLDMRMWGANPLVVPSPNIEWRLKIKFDIITSRNSKVLQMKCAVGGKGFPAYESFITDSAGMEVFIFTLPSPRRGQLLVELTNPLYDRFDHQGLKIEIDENGNFTGKIWVKKLTTESRNDYYLNYGNMDGSGSWSEMTIEQWNRINYDKKPAPDCQKGECGI